MSDVLKPATEAELAEIVAAARGPFEIIGTGTKRRLGRPMQTAATLDMSGFASVISYEPEELVLEVGAGMRLTDIEALISAKGQQLAFEPPDYSTLLGSAHSGTIGGLISCNLSGPRRIKAGAARDHILGVRAVTGTGDIFKSGARVVKNVTGYDLAKLVTGAYGTLAAMTSIIVKVLPSPETEETVVLTGLDAGEAVAAMSAALQSSCEVAGAAHVPGQGTYLRLEGIAPSVAYRRDKLAVLLGRPIEVMAAKSSAALWASVRDAKPVASEPERQVWKLSVTPDDAPQLVSRLTNEMGARCLLDWGGGLVWAALPPSPDASKAAVRGALGSGHATLMRAPDAVRATVDVLQPQPPALAALSARVKDSFDPRHLFNPGRMSRVF